MASFNFATEDLMLTGEEILSRHLHDDVAIVLCKRDDAHYDPYVVWRVDPTTGDAFWGSYHKNYALAVEAYRKRVTENLGG